MSQNKTSMMNLNGRTGLHSLDPEVVVRAKRRRFSAADKRRILEEADACGEPGQVGALMRREGIYSSYLSDWRRERASGELPGESKQPHGRQQTEKIAEVARLRQENEQLKAQVAQAELIITAQKKLAQALEHTLMLNKGVRS
jgi:transposase-like protein